VDDDVGTADFGGNSDVIIIIIIIIIIITENLKYQ
jgi:hypothetical protein